MTVETPELDPAVIRAFPEAAWKPLRPNDLYRLQHFVDQTWWDLLKEFWGIKSVSLSRIKADRKPMYPRYKKKSNGKKASQI